MGTRLDGRARDLEGGTMLSAALGLLAASWAVVMALGPVLQIREILRRRSSAGLSLGYLAVLLVGFALWVAYGVASDDLPLVVPNTLAFLVMCVTIGVVVRYRRRGTTAMRHDQDLSSQTPS
jgi:MtN3 and saliva related transmembrane protein